MDGSSPWGSPSGAGGAGGGRPPGSPGGRGGRRAPPRPPSRDHPLDRFYNAARPHVPSPLNTPASGGAAFVGTGGGSGADGSPPPRPQNPAPQTAAGPSNAPRPSIFGLQGRTAAAPARMGLQPDLGPAEGADGPPAKRRKASGGLRVDIDLSDDDFDAGAAQPLSAPVTGPAPPAGPLPLARSATTGALPRPSIATRTSSAPVITSSGAVLNLQRGYGGRDGLLVAIRSGSLLAAEQIMLLLREHCPEADPALLQEAEAAYASQIVPTNPAGSPTARPPATKRSASLNLLGNLGKRDTAALSASAARAGLVVQPAPVVPAPNGAAVPNARTLGTLPAFFVSPLGRQLAAMSTATPPAGAGRKDPAPPSAAFAPAGLFNRQAAQAVPAPAADAPHLALALAGGGAARHVAPAVDLSSLRQARAGNAAAGGAVASPAKQGAAAGGSANADPQRAVPFDIDSYMSQVRAARSAGRNAAAGGAQPAAANQGTVAPAALQLGPPAQVQGKAPAQQQLPRSAQLQHLQTQLSPFQVEVAAQASQHARLAQRQGTAKGGTAGHATAPAARPAAPAAPNPAPGPSDPHRELRHLLDESHQPHAEAIASLRSMGFPLVRILAVLDSILARGAHPGLEAVLDGLTEPAPAEQEAPAPPPPEPAKEARNECVICLSAPCTRAVIPCGHQSLCEDCVGMAAGMGECPVCRGEWKGTLRIFQA